MADILAAKSRPIGTGLEKYPGAFGQRCVFRPACLLCVSFPSGAGPCVCTHAHVHRLCLENKSENQHERGGRDSMRRISNSIHRSGAIWFCPGKKTPKTLLENSTLNALSCFAVDVETFFLSCLAGVSCLHLVSPSCVTNHVVSTSDHPHSGRDWTTRDYLGAEQYPEGHGAETPVFVRRVSNKSEGLPATLAGAKEGVSLRACVRGCV